VNYGQHTDAELLRHADLAQNDLTTTDLERELLERLEGQVEENILNAGAIEVLEEFDIDTLNTRDLERLRDALQLAADFPEGRALLEVLEEFDIDTLDTRDLERLRDALQLAADFPEGRALLEVLQAQDIDDFEVLAKKLERLTQFDQVMEDLTDPLTTLQSLVTTE
jgi:hypothetical protein